MRQNSHLCFSTVNELAKLISTKKMTLFSSVSYDYRFELIHEAKDFARLRKALLINPMVVINETSNEFKMSSNPNIIACKMLLKHPNYVLLELDFNFFYCPFELTHRLLEICPSNAIVVMSGLGFARGSNFLEPMTRYAEFLYAQDSRANERLNRKRYLSTLKSDIKRTYNIPLEILIYVFFALIVGYLLGFAFFLFECRKSKKLRSCSLKIDKINCCKRKK